MTMTPSRVQSGGTGGKPWAIRSTMRIVYAMKDTLKEGKPPYWGRIQGPSMARLTQLLDLLV